MSERIEVDVGLDGDEVEFGVSEDACEVGGLRDVRWGEPFPGDPGVGGAQVFGYHGGSRRRRKRIGRRSR
jgi:hypothetical protein